MFRRFLNRGRAKADPYSEAEEDRHGELGIRLFSEYMYREAIPHFQYALQTAIARKDIRAQATWYGNLGSALSSFGNDIEAVLCFENALRLVRQYGDKEHEEFLLSNIGAVYAKMGRFATAIEYLKTGLSSAQENGNRENVGHLSGHIGNVYSMSGALQLAEEYYKDALKIAEDFGDKHAIGQWLGNLGNTYAKALNFESAIQYYDRALKVARETKDIESENRWLTQRKTASEQLRSHEKNVAQNRKPDPSKTPGGFIFNGLAIRVSQLPDIEQKRQLLLSEQKLIDSAIQEAIQYKEATYALAMIDCVKSLVSRELLFRKRLEIAGIDSNVDLVIHGFNPSQITDELIKDPHLCAIAFYYSRDFEFYAFIAYSRDNVPIVEKVNIAVGQAGRNLYAALAMLSQKRKEGNRNEIDSILANLLNDIGQSVLPRIPRDIGIKRILLIPHKLLYLLPLHVMLNMSPKSKEVLEEIGPVTYSSSLMNYSFRGKAGRSEKPSKFLLYFMDAQNLHSSASTEREFFELTFRGIDGADLVYDPTGIPQDLGAYQFLNWSSHGISDPTNWANSFLTAGKRVYSSSQIIEQWHLHNTVVAVLSACDTGADYSVDNFLDEYCGLDMAVHIAGAQTVVSTMWPVSESLAGFMSVALADGVFRHHELPSEYLREIRFDLATGNWQQKLKTNYMSIMSNTNVEQRTKDRYLRILDRLLAHDQYAFQNISNWAIYRSFGGW